MRWDGLGRSWLLLPFMFGAAAATAVAFRATRALCTRQRRRPLSASMHGNTRQFDGYPVPSSATLMHPHSDYAHRYWSDIIRTGDTLVDATAGNGHDASFLATALGLVGGGTLYVIDIQAEAIMRSKDRLRQTLEQQGWELHEESACKWHARMGGDGGFLAVHWVLGCHLDALNAITQRSVRLVVFNLGYLPGGDKSVCTTTATTLPALDAAQQAIQIGELSHPRKRPKIGPIASAQVPISSISTPKWNARMIGLHSRCSR